MPTNSRPRTTATNVLLPLACLALAAVAVSLGGCASSPPTAAAPTHRVDATWPKPLPNNWILGQMSGVAVDADDRIWVLQRPRTLTEDEAGAAQKPPQSKCCVGAPPVLVFDAAGDLLKAWDGPGPGYDWPESEPGIYVDAKGFVWITGNGDNDGQILRFTGDGKFVLQIGKVGLQTGNGDTTRLGRAANVEVEVATNEVYVAEGYYNRRVIVFDAETGAFKRLGGAYGKPPTADANKPVLRRTAPPTTEQLQQFGNPVHCVRLARDGLLYVCDRINNRVQVFRRDGTYVKEFAVEPHTIANGSVWDIVLSRDPEQRWIFLADGRNNQVVVIARSTGAIVSTFGRPGRYAGEFHRVHDLAIDSQGNL